LREAATIRGKSLADFLVDAGMAAAGAELPEGRVYALDEPAWAVFMAALDAPPSENPALRDLLSRQPMWRRHHSEAGAERELIEPVLKGDP